MQKSHGFRHGTRKLMTKRPREKGLRPLDYLLQDFNEGDIVDVIIDSSQHKAMPHRRYHGNTGIIQRVQGDAYVVSVKQGRIKKQVVTTREHLRLSRSNINQKK